MPKIDDDEKVEQTNNQQEIPEPLKPYQFHFGAEKGVKQGNEQVYPCPFCNRPKFSVRAQTGQHRCLVCDVSGNQYTFIRELNARLIQDKRLVALARNRRLLNEKALKSWGIGHSPIGRSNVLIPGYSIDGKVSQLYQYMPVDGKFRALPTPGLGQQMFRHPKWDRKKATVYITEGVWDGIALHEVLEHATKGEDGQWSYVKEKSLGELDDANILSTPGTQVFPEQWASLCAGKRVVILFDNDPPRSNPRTKEVALPAGLQGTKRIAQILATAEEKPASIDVLLWSDEGYDSELPEGYDLRDHFAKGSDIEERVALWQELQPRIRPMPQDWLTDAAKASTGVLQEKPKLEVINCVRWEELADQWRLAMRWTDGLDNGLAAMLACITSTMSVGDQLWVRIIGPASCGKSTLCEAISVAHKYVVAKSTIRGFHSGYGEEGEDCSLLAQVAGRTLVVKDGDTLLQSPNLGQILAEARDVFDTNSRTHYRNKQSKSYTGVRMTWILCGTSSLLSLDQSELGERFLTCILMDGIDDELEDDILWRVATRAEANMAYAVDTGSPESHQDPELTKAMQMTGGYVEFLRENAQKLLSACTMGEDGLRMCTRLGKFVAYMRARPSKRQDQTAEREVAARLVSQHTRLAKCLAVAVGESSVNMRVMHRVTKIALDTCRGQVLEMTRHMWHQPEGVDIRSLSLYTGFSEESTRNMLRFLRRIGAVEHEQRKAEGIVSSKVVWKLSANLKALYKEVLSYQGAE